MRFGYVLPTDPLKCGMSPKHLTKSIKEPLWTCERTSSQTIFIHFLCYFKFLFTYSFVYLKGREMETNTETWREHTPIYQFTPQMFLSSRTWPVQIRSLEFNPASSEGCGNPSHYLLPPRLHISRWNQEQSQGYKPDTILLFQPCSNASSLFTGTDLIVF